MKTHRSPTHKRTMIGKALIAAFAVASSGSVLAQTNYWVGPGDFTDEDAWSAASTNVPGANVVNDISATWGLDSSNNSVYLGSAFYIGHAAEGSLNINSSDFGSISIDIDETTSGIDPAPSTLDQYVDPFFRVGDAEGHGHLRINVQSTPTGSGGSGTVRLYVEEVGLGVGLGNKSEGIVDVLGSGKTLDQMTNGSPNMVGFFHTQQNSVIGHDGGEGKVNLDGAGLGFTPNVYNGPLPLFMVGDGGSSKGSINVLNNGKLSVGDSYSGDTTDIADQLPLSFIGNRSGEGTVTVESSASGEFGNQASFNLGLVVGSASGNGTLNVLANGKATISNGPTSTSNGTCSATDPNLPLASVPLQISADNTASGLVRVSGTNAQLIVAGLTNNADDTVPTVIQENTIGQISIGTGGSLITENNAVIKVGVNHLTRVSTGAPNWETYGNRVSVGGLGPIIASGAGQIVYGSETTTPTAAGSIEASLINLNSADAQVAFNHTGSLTFNIPLSGTGKLTQQAGTTTISGDIVEFPSAALTTNKFEFDTTPDCKPDIADGYLPDHAAFTGGIDVQGGTLTLPSNDVLPYLSTTNISGGTLLQGGTDQNLGAVTQTGGVIQLTGGTTSQATDTATATSWAGSNGTVALDTVLGLDGNDSDKLHITGPISGTTLLHISNLGGTGAQTTADGILVVQADVAHPDDSFALATPVIANGFEYTLKQTGNNWYLVSSPTAVQPSVVAKPVPSMSGLGLLGLGSLLAAFSAFSLRRRQR
ncbi:pertactin-like passenger domain-containing protein [Lampropedia puyangensis]|nr:pertactin-like passenger domain-containing protein [Lampropedia puyangensis]